MHISPWTSTRYVPVITREALVLKHAVEGDCRSVEVFRVEFLTLKHPIWEDLLKFFLKKLVCLSF